MTVPNVGIQVSPPTENMSTSCCIRIDEEPTNCPNSTLRKYFNILTSEHSYAAKTSSDYNVSNNAVPLHENVTTSTPIKNDRMPPSDVLITSIKHVETESDFGETPTEDPSFHLSDSLTDSDNDSNDESDEGDIAHSSVRDSKFIVFMTCLQTLLGFVRCQECGEGLCHEDTKQHLKGTCVVLFFYIFKRTYIFLAFSAFYWTTTSW